MTVRLRTMEADYLNVSTNSGTPKYAFMGVGFTKADESPSAKTTSKQYINQKNAVQTITSYDWKMAVEADQIKEEEAIQYIMNIGRNELVGSDAETDYIKVDLDSPVSGSANTYEARKRNVAIQVSDFSSKDGEMGLKANFLAKSDIIIGTFNTSTRTFTPGPANTSVQAES